MVSLKALPENTMQVKLVKMESVVHTNYESILTKNAVESREKDL